MGVAAAARQDCTSGQLPQQQWSLTVVCLLFSAAMLVQQLA
jgi:hypothetical protein